MVGEVLANKMVRAAYRMQGHCVEGLMMFWMRAMAVAVVIAAGLVALRGACLNDTRTEQAEKEFRSRYEAGAPRAADEAFVVGGVNVLGIGVTAAGVVLAVTGMAGSHRAMRRRRVA